MVYRNPLLIDPIEGRAAYLLRDGVTLKQAGTRDKDGYVIVRYDGRTQKLHRVIYELVWGPITKGLQIDHINGIKNDNRIVNLRLVTSSMNAQNRHHAQAHSKTGVKGVSWKPHIQKYVAQICVAGRVKHIGSYATLHAATAAYGKAAAEYHTHNPKGE